MTKKFTKALLIAVCALVLVAATFAGTLAYLTDSAEISNTFTAGKVDITMDEGKVDVYGEATTPAERVTNTNVYKLIPGKQYSKDPIIHVAKESKKCYLFIDINNEIATIEAAGSVTAQLATNGWAKLYPENDTSNVWYYTQVVDARENAKDVTTFTYFAIKGDIDGDVIASFAGKSITITAYAVQAEGFDTAAAAWSATFGASTQPQS